MHVEIITPEFEIFKGKAESLRLPGLDGYFGILSNHAPLLASLKTGGITINYGSESDQVFNDGNGKVQHEFSNGNKTLDISIKGGTVEVLHNKVIILAE